MFTTSCDGVVGIASSPHLPHGFQTSVDFETSIVVERIERLINEIAVNELHQSIVIGEYLEPRVQSGSRNRSSSSILRVLYRPSRPSTPLGKNVYLRELLQSGCPFLGPPLFAKLRRCYTGSGMECSRECALIKEVAGQRDFSYRLLGFEQHV